MEERGLKGFGRRLREERGRNGMNQSELARAIGVTRAAVSKWEKDSSTDASALGVCLAAAELKTTVNYLLTGQKKPPLNISHETLMNFVASQDWLSKRGEKVLSNLGRSKREKLSLQLVEMIGFERFIELWDARQDTKRAKPKKKRIKSSGRTSA